MAVSKLQLARVGPFEEAEFDLVPGVNVFLGANSTGKTFAMKSLYSVLKSFGPELKPGSASKEALREKLAGVFRPDDGDIRRLVSRTHGKSTGRIRVHLDDGTEVQATISTAARNPVAKLNLGPTLDRPVIKSTALFLPSREVLAMFEGFVAAYQQRELAFDETYYDTAVALSAAALRGPRPGKLRTVVERLEGELGGKVRLEGPRFYLHSGNAGRLEAHLLAEGLRKVASIVHLIANGALRSGGTLLWDEPEANLHPRLAEVVVECLGALAGAGVQVLLATHDYLLADAVSRWNEYRGLAEFDASARFFQLRLDTERIVVDSSSTFAGLPSNELLGALLRHHDREQDLIARDLDA